MKAINPLSDALLRAGVRRMTPNQIEKIALYAIARGAPLNYHKIAAALNNGLTVLADTHAGGQALVCRNVRRSQTKEGVQVLTLEGWRSPLRVYTKEQPELPFMCKWQTRNGSYSNSP